MVGAATPQILQIGCELRVLACLFVHKAFGFDRAEVAAVTPQTLLVALRGKKVRAHHVHLHFCHSHGLPLHFVVIYVYFDDLNSLRWKTIPLYETAAE